VGQDGIIHNVAVDRMVCADLPAFPLQLLLRRRPQWRNLPVAVVSKEAPQGEIVIPSRKARRKGVVVGISYAAALGLAPELRAATVSQADMDDNKTAVMERLQRFSPKVQGDMGYSGAFWMDGSGLGRLYPSAHTWANRIRTALCQLGFRAVVVIGFSRFGTFALARKASRKTMVLNSPEEEAALARSVLLEHLVLPSWITQELSKLGKHTVGDLLQLPPDGLLERYGPLVYRLWRLAACDLQEPLVAGAQKDSPAVSLILDHPESNALRLTFLIKRLLRELLSRIAAGHEALGELEITLRLYGDEHVVEHLRPAQPTLNETQLVNLVRLRLENTPLESGVMEIQLGARTVPSTAKQLPLFVKHHRRNREAADRAFARLRAQFGPEAVVRIKMHPGHLPEARFSFEPVEHAPFPKATGQRRPTLVRRVFTQPFPLTGFPVPSESGILQQRVENAFSHLSGPDIRSGGWWNRAIHREYYFAQTKGGDILWIYFDGKRKQWFLHGTLE
jgi:protein ImuB